jgi:hypothetical protein
VCKLGFEGGDFNGGGGCRLGGCDAGFLGCFAIIIHLSLSLSEAAALTAGEPVTVVWVVQPFYETHLGGGVRTAFSISLSNFFRSKLLNSSRSFWSASRCFSVIGFFGFDGFFVTAVF